MVYFNHFCCSCPFSFYSTYRYFCLDFCTCIHLLLIVRTLVETNDVAKYVCKSKGKSHTYQQAKSIISESVEMGQSTEKEELLKRVEEQSEMHPLCPSIALAYHSVLKDCEEHCSSEGWEVKKLGGLHVIGTSLHESRRIDNQVSNCTGGKVQNANTFLQ